MQDYILRRAFTASTSASSSIVVIYDLGLGIVYDWFMSMHDMNMRNMRKHLNMAIKWKLYLHTDLHSVSLDF